MTRTIREFFGIYKTVPQGLSGKSLSSQNPVPSWLLPQHLGSTLWMVDGMIQTKHLDPKFRCCLLCYQLLHHWQAMTHFYKMGDGSGVGWGGGLWLYLVRLLCTETVPVRSLAELRKYALSL